MNEIEKPKRKRIPTPTINNSSLSDLDRISQFREENPCTPIVPNETHRHRTESDTSRNLFQQIERNSMQENEESDTSKSFSPERPSQPSPASSFREPSSLPPNSSSSLPLKSSTEITPQNSSNGFSSTDQNVGEFNPPSEVIHDPILLRRNAEFHRLFQSIPINEILIEDYVCALQKDILIQGRIYLTRSYVCFYANIFGWITSLVIKMVEIVNLEKKNTAVIIPNAIQINTLHSKHFFTSFLYRDKAFQQLLDLWQRSHPGLSLRSAPSISERSDTHLSECDDSESFSDATSSRSGVSISEEKDMDKPSAFQTGFEDFMKKAPSVFPQIKSFVSSVQTMMTGPDGSQTTIGSSSPNKPRSQSLSHPSSNTKEDEYIHVSKTDPDLHSTMTQSDQPSLPPSLESLTLNKLPTPPSEETFCSCLANQEHLDSLILDEIYPCHLQVLYHLFFTDDTPNDLPLWKTFLQNEMNSQVTECTQWVKSQNPSLVETRDLTYIKPLRFPMGPKSTRCILTEECLHKDFANYVIVEQTVGTPDIPSGSSFSVKTRICLMHAKKSRTRCIVTSKVNFTKTLWIKGAIEKASLEGTSSHFKGFDHCVKAFLSSHPSLCSSIPRSKSKLSRRIKQQKFLPKSVPPSPFMSLINLSINFLLHCVTRLVLPLFQLSLSELVLLFIMMLLLYQTFWIQRQVDLILEQQTLVNQMLEHLHRVLNNSTLTDVP